MRKLYVIFWLLALSLCVPVFGQNASPLPPPKIQFFDQYGAPLAGGFVYTYAAGTTTPLASFTDSTGNTANTNPVTLDSGGFANIWLLANECYKVVVQNAASVQISSTDNVCAPINSGSLNVSLASPPPIGITTPNTVDTTQLRINPGSGCNSTWCKFQQTVNSTTGEMDGKFLTSTNTPSDSVQVNQWLFQPFFKTSTTGVSGLGIGVWTQKAPFFPYQVTGGPPWQGTGNTYAMIDPTGYCTVTHTGAGSTGVGYWMTFLDAQQSPTMPAGTTTGPTCTDPSGYPTPDSTHKNIITYYQPQGGANDYGGSFSDVAFSRTATTGIWSNYISSFLNVTGGGTISNITPCNNYSTSPCTFTDDGSYDPLVTLSTLAGYFYDGVGANYTNDTHIQGGIINLTRGNKLNGGSIQSGQTRTTPIATPSAPTVAVATAGAGSCDYAIIVNDITGTVSPTDLSEGHTLPSADGTAASCTTGAVSWNITFACNSVTVLKHTGGSYYSMTGSTKLPCYGQQYFSGPGVQTTRPFTFTDPGSYTLFTVPTRNTTADIFADSSGSAGQGAGVYALNGQVEGYYGAFLNNSTSPHQISCVLSGSACDNTSGYVRSDAGDGSVSGKMFFYKPGSPSAETWQVGGDSGNDLTFAAQLASSHFIIGSNAVLRLGAVTGSTQCLHVDSSGNVTGTGADCGSSTGNVSGPGTSTVGHIATWNNNTGTSLADSGSLANAAGGTGQNSSAWTGIPVTNAGTWSNMVGSQGQLPIYGASGVPTTLTERVYAAAGYGGAAGIIADDATDQSAALQGLLSTMAAANHHVELVLPVGNYILINSASITWPGNVDIVGCGPYGNQSGSGVKVPSCGFDLQYNAPIAKVFFLDKAQVVSRDVAWVDNGSDSAPFFLVTNTNVHFFANSYRGSTNLNDIWLFGNTGACTGSGTSDCFAGYGSQIIGGFVQYAKRFGVYQSAAASIGMGDIMTDFTSQNPTGGFIELVGGTAPVLSNTFWNITVETGAYPPPGAIHYKYIIDIQSGHGVTALGISAGDVPNQSPTRTYTIHTASGIQGNVLSCGYGYYSTGGPALPCVLQDTNYGNTVFDPNVSSSMNKLQANYVGLAGAQYAGVTYFNAQAYGVYGFNGYGGTSYATDTGLSRDAAGVVDVGNGTAGDTSGTIQLKTLSVSQNIANGTTNTDASGTLTASAAVATYTFVGTYSNAPVCTIQNRTSFGAGNITAVTVTNTTITVGTAGATDKVVYMCQTKG